MATVGYFEVQVDDFKRAQDFYKEVFGWNFSKFDAPFEYYSIDTGKSEGQGIDGGMVKRQQPLAESNGVSGYVCAIYVKSVDETLEKLEKQGGKVTMPKTNIPGVGNVAYALDSEGNAIGLWEIV
jgi:predicted enzyme related to lactoylglutathione lyase